jgi:hypothetical protein
MIYMGPMQNQITRPYLYTVLMLESRKSNVRIYIQNVFGRKYEVEPTVSEISKLWDPMQMQR